MTTPTPDELERIQQAILEREVEEALQRERLQKFWEKYKFTIIGCVIAIVVGTAGGQLYQNWKKEVRLSESDQFESAVLLNHTNKKEQAVSVLEDLSRSAHTGYGSLAELKLASIYFEQGKQEEALNTLKSVFENSSTPKSLQAVARLSYVGHQINSDTDSAVLLNTLEPLLKAENAYYASAIELKTAILINQGKQEEAQNLVKASLENTTVTGTAKERLSALALSLEK